jgi:hypothetical protein
MFPLEEMTCAVHHNELVSIDITWIIKASAVFMNNS